MPPTFTAEDGQRIEANPLQAWLWACWLDLVDRVKICRRQGAKVFVVVGGDTCENNHHATIEVLTADEEAHVNLAVDILTPLMALADGCAFVAGSSAHSGPKAILERRVAAHFVNRGMVKTQSGGFVHSTFKRTVFGLRLNVAHKARGGRTERLRLMALSAEVERYLIRVGKVRQPKADYLVRGHVHFMTDTGTLYETRAATTGCWQFPTEYVTNLAPDELPDIGALLIGVYADGTHEFEAVRYPAVTGDEHYPEVTLDAEAV
jgi:hypothetical protein